MGSIPEGWRNLAGGEERQRHYPRTPRPCVPTLKGSRKARVGPPFPAPLQGAATSGSLTGGGAGALPPAKFPHPSGMKPRPEGVTPIPLNPNSEVQPRKGAENTKQPRRKCRVAGQFLSGPHAARLLGSALFVPFRGQSVSEFGVKTAGKQFTAASPPVGPLAAMSARRSAGLPVVHSPRRLHALLEMRHQIGGHERDAFRIAHQRLQRGPLRLELLLLRQLLAFGDFGARYGPGSPTNIMA